MQQDAAIKIESARDTRKEIVDICLRHLKSPDNSDFKRLGAKFGTLANDLRSALNYTMNSFVINKLGPLIMADGGTAINKTKRDFPWAKKKGEFDKKELVKHTRRYYPKVYGLLEQNQVWNGQDWLQILMRISNEDKHERITLTRIPNIQSILAYKDDGKRLEIPQILGDRIMVRDQFGLRMFPLPYYFAPLNFFATVSGWKLFLVKVNDKQSKQVLPFSSFLIKSVEQLIVDFEALW